MKMSKKGNINERSQIFNCLISLAHNKSDMTKNRNEQRWSTSFPRKFNQSDLMSAQTLEVKI